MFFHFKQSNEAKRLSWKVREYMRQRFTLSEEYLSELRCFEYEEGINERDVLRILIFHPRFVRSQHVLLKTHTDLEQHPEVLFYKGYEDDIRGSLYIEDWRKMAYPNNTSSQRL